MKSPLSDFLVYGAFTIGFILFCMWFVPLILSCHCGG